MLRSCSTLTVPITSCSRPLWPLERCWSTRTNLVSTRPRTPSLTLRKTADQVFATAASFADITDFTCPMLSGHKYSFEAFIFHITNATTTGAQFGVNIGAAPTLLIAGGAHQITSSLTAAGFGASSAVTARDTAIVAETTGPGAVVATANIAGTIIPSADGTFALRATSEVTVANGLTVKAGSLLRIREYDN
jgi:hypothetical protein